MVLDSSSADMRGVHNILAMLKNSAGFTAEQITALHIIGGNSFAYCTNLKNLSFEDGIYELKFNKYSISSACFEACPIETLYLGRTIYCPFYKPFGNLSNLTKVTIGHYVTRLCSELFSEAELLSEIVIPASVICIEPYVFMNCRQLNKVVFEDGGNYSAVALLP